MPPSPTVVTTTKSIYRHITPVDNRGVQQGAREMALKVNLTM